MSKVVNYGLIIITFPLGFPSFPHLDLFFIIILVTLLYRMTYGLCINLVNLTLLNHYPKFY